MESDWFACFPPTKKNGCPNGFIKFGEKKNVPCSKTGDVCCFILPTIQLEVRCIFFILNHRIPTPFFPMQLDLFIAFRSP